MSITGLHGCQNVDSSFHFIFHQRFRLRFLNPNPTTPNEKAGRKLVGKGWCSAVPETTSDTVAAAVAAAALGAAVRQ